MNEKEKELIKQFVGCVIDIFGGYSFDENEYSDEYVVFGASEVEKYCIEYDLSLEEIKMVHDLFRDVDFRVAGWIKITLGITNSIFYFYSQFRDIDMTLDYIYFLESVHFEYEYSSEVEDYINDIVDCVKKHGIHILKEIKNLYWWDAIERIIELNANTQ